MVLVCCAYCTGERAYSEDTLVKHVALWRKESRMVQRRGHISKDHTDLHGCCCRFGVAVIDTDLTR